ncbi:hypothetical protein A2707_05110 [Candidatus Saccharibacteria bacterium RIFCSPHIGHO2_01_FULL_45_15]|nr:MAG: hypothetical protein A2707_05110 [Candidatus Saccharibacteria bacterium RIFCSPHIGHO2_01_FULL_45_15]OGL28850.1 MAG: hypothetical protein A3C39_03485 [Candidatus Saccharibacteria bacterium RIFCSPHIGHO2_02_FULL_46_12]OGL32655.1 MAG: hypothetical protein A3E76_04855 [Candidatus Saccharibacteria bacterium RIFCSPHIGHO2_12_FULL_44_22]
MSKKIKRERRERQTRTKVIITIIAVLLVVGLSIGGFFVWRSYQAAQNGTDDESGAPSDADIARARESFKQSRDDGDLRQKAFEEVGNNDTDAANKVYQQAIAAETSQERKTELAIDLSGVYYAAGQYDKAFAAMKEVEVSNPDKFLVADWLSRLYEDQKDYSNAAKYYRLAGEWAKSPQNKTGIEKSFYDAEADRVSKLGGV